MSKFVSSIRFPPAAASPKRFAVALLDFERLNRRMHNRLFIVDRVMAVTGGRNLCDEYFMRSARSNLFDYDAFVVGPVVSQVSSLFDEYWNAEQVWTAASV